MSPLVIFNLVAAYPFFHYAETNHIQKYDSNTFYPFVNFLLWLLTTDLLFYTIHRAFHTKYLYFIHSIHHNFNYTYGMGAIYAHPIELYLANLLPLAAPMIIFKIPHRQCDIIVFFSTMYTIIISHGGFKLKMGSGHLYHHLKYKCNYGLLKMDRFMGTKYSELGTPQPPSFLGTSHPPSLLGTSHPPSFLGTSHPPSFLGTSQPPSFLGTSHPPSFLGTSHPPSFLGTSQPPSFLGTSQPPSFLGTSQINLPPLRKLPLMMALPCLPCRPCRPCRPCLPCRPCRPCRPCLHRPYPPHLVVQFGYKVLA